MKDYINSLGERIDTLSGNIKDLTQLNIGFFCFKFLKTSSMQTKIILDEVDKQYLRDNCLDIFQLVKIMRLNQVAFKLVFKSDVTLSDEENLNAYAYDFLPFYVKLNNTGWLPEY